VKKENNEEKELRNKNRLTKEISEKVQSCRIVSKQTTQAYAAVYMLSQGNRAMPQLFLSA